MMTSAWKWPGIIAVLTMTGLFAALIGGAGFWRIAAWLALASPIAIALVGLGKAVWKRGRGNPQ